MSVATETVDPTIVDGLTALSDEPAAAAQPGASCQWQMLQPAGHPSAPPEAQTRSVSALNDPWIGDLRRRGSPNAVHRVWGPLPRSSSLTKGVGLCPADSPAEITRTALKSSASRGKPSLIDPARFWIPYAGSSGDRRSVFLPRACGNSVGTRPICCAGAGQAIGQAFPSRNLHLPLPPGRRGSAAHISSRQAITAPGGREHIEHERRS